MRNKYFTGGTSYETEKAIKETVSGLSFTRCKSNFRTT
jgi:hypothetical protein